MIRSIERAFKILDLISNTNNSPTAAQIAQKLKMNRVTVHHVVQTLASQGYLRKDEDTHRYQIGLRILPVAAKLLDTNKLRIESLPYLYELAQKSGERVNLGILFEGEVLYLAGIEKPTLPLVYTRFGKKAPAHCSSLGKVILAYWPEEKVDHLLKQRPPIQFTENTITDPRLFKEHLAEIRSQGYAVDQEEHLPGYCCIAALIRGLDGDGIGSISISSGNLGKIRGCLQDLLYAAEIISHRMGYTLR